LQLTEIYRGRNGVDGIPKRLTGGYDFGVGPAGRGAVSLELMGVPQRPGGGDADGQVVRVQMLQGAARLGDDGFCVVLNYGQRGPQGGDTPNKVLGSVVWFGALQGRFGGS
jgi:hypothetical protein